MPDEDPPLHPSQRETEIVTRVDLVPSGGGPRATSLAPGEVLFGAYEILGVLGSGAMASVYRARHRDLGSLRAIKVMHPDVSARPRSVDRFQREARALLEVHHPAVVRCHDLLRDPDGRFYLVMELIEGIPLSEQLDRSGALDETGVRALAARLAEGLAAAHASGVVHRDLSPDNVVLPDGRPELAKIIDFGIAKLLQDRAQTAPHTFKGKLAYASPEQLGFFGGKTDARSDYFSLGLVLCEAALGRPLEMGDTFAEAVDARRRAVRLPRQIPRGLRRELAPLLERDPDARPADLQSWLGDGPKRAPGAGGNRRRRTRLGLALVGLALAAAAAILWWGSPREGAGLLHGDPMTRFATLTQALLAAGSNSSARIAVHPSPVRDGGTYTIRIESDCACTPLVFSISGAGDRIDLVYPNPFDPPTVLAIGEGLEIPTDPLSYRLQAEAGVGADRLKLLLVPGFRSFPDESEEPWSATPETAAQGAELARLLDSVAGRQASGSEATLQISR